MTTRKNITPITSGEINFPKKIPNLNQALFKGDKILEFNKPKIKKINEMIIDQILKLPLCRTGYSAINKNTIEKIIPKLLFELLFISLFMIKF